MLRKRKRNLCEEYIYSNRLRLLINICFATVGIVCGCMIFLYASDRQMFFEKLSETVELIGKTDEKNIFVSALTENALVCAVFYICSFFSVGVYISYFYVFLRCIAYGFSNCAFISCYGLNGLYALAAGIMPYMILYMSALMIFCTETAKQSGYVKHCSDKNLKRRASFGYFVFSILPVLLLFAGSVVESFASSHIILWCMKKN